jgi:hypothetical protein
MFPVRKQLRSFVWLALMAMLAMALLPTVSHALASSQALSSGWTEVCTPQGTQWVAQDGTPLGDAAPSASADHQLDCPYCRPSSVIAGLPPVPAVWLPPVSGQAEPALFFHAPRTLFAWASAQPRGPPAEI